MTLSDKINGYDPLTQIVVKGDIRQVIKKILSQLTGNLMQDIKMIKEEVGEELTK